MPNTESFGALSAVKLASSTLNGRFAVRGAPCRTSAEVQHFCVASAFKLLQPMQSRQSGKWVVPAVDPSWLLTCRAASCQARCSGGPVHSCSLPSHPPLPQQLHQKIPQQKKLRSQTPVQSRQHLDQNATHGFHIDQKQRLDEDQYLLFLFSKHTQQLQTNN